VFISRLLKCQYSELEVFYLFSIYILLLCCRCVLYAAYVLRNVSFHMYSHVITDCSPSSNYCFFVLNKKNFNKSIFTICFSLNTNNNSSKNNNDGISSSNVPIRSTQHVYTCQRNIFRVQPYNYITGFNRAILVRSWRVDVQLFLLNSLFTQRWSNDGCSQ